MSYRHFAALVDTTVHNLRKHCPFYWNAFGNSYRRPLHDWWLYVYISAVRIMIDVTLFGAENTALCLE